MSRDNLARLTRWLDGDRHPLLLQMTEAEFAKFGLPLR